MYPQFKTRSFYL